MLRWGLALTAILVAALSAAGWAIGIRTPAFRAIFFLTLTLWQSAIAVCIYCRSTKHVRADCLGVGLLFVLVTVAYVLVRYPQSWRVIVPGSPVLVAAALAGAWMAWRASEGRS